MSISVKKIFLNPYTISLVALVGVVFLLIWGTLKWIDSYTNHGIELVVPDVTDLTAAEAATMLKEKNLKCEVVDSTFMKGKKLGAVVEQIPSPGSKVKENRTIYLITNSSSVRRIVLPDVREISLRQAEAMINSVGLKVENIEYVPSEYKDLVKDVKYKGKILTPGFRIPEGAPVVLLVGCGDTNEEIVVPSFRSLNAEQAISKAHAVFLNIGETIYDVQPKDEKDSQSYFVYKQSPITGFTTAFGSAVNIYLTKDPTLLEIPEEVYDPNAAEGNPFENSQK